LKRPARLPPNKDDFALSDFLDRLRWDNQLFGLALRRACLKAHFDEHAGLEPLTGIRNIQANLYGACSLVQLRIDVLTRAGMAEGPSEADLISAGVPTCKFRTAPPAH